MKNKFSRISWPPSLLIRQLASMFLYAYLSQWRGFGKWVWNNSFRSISIAAGAKGMGCIGYPDHPAWEVTARCNLKCLHCYCVEEKTRRELSLAEIKKLLEELAELGCFSLTFSGGEALTREDFFAILAIAKKLHYVITIFSNGVNIDSETADKIASFSPFGVEFSLYGTTPQAHEKITRVEGSFQKTCQAIKLLKARGVEVTVKWPLLKEILPHHFELVEFAKGLGLVSRADPLIFPVTTETVFLYHSV